MNKECQEVTLKECSGSASSEGLIEDEDEDAANQERLEEEPDLLDSAFLRDGITLEPEKESSNSGEDSDGLYDFKDTLGVAQYSSNTSTKRTFSLHIRQPRQSEYVYGKRYTARWVQRIDPSQLPSLMSLKVQPPERAGESCKDISDHENDSTQFSQCSHRYKRRRRSSQSLSSTHRTRNRSRSRSPPKRSSMSSRDRVHRSPTSIERFRYWTGDDYHPPLSQFHNTHFYTSELLETRFSPWKTRNASICLKLIWVAIHLLHGDAVTNSLLQCS